MSIVPSRRIGALPVYPVADVPQRKRAAQARGLDVIDLGAGDNDTPPPAVVTAAMREALAVPGLQKYGFQQGLLPFREAVVRWMARRFGQAFDPVTEVLPLIGSKDGLAHLPLALCDAGDTVIVPAPAYPAYLGSVVLAGADAHVVPLTPANRFLCELDDQPAAVLARAKLVYLNYPNNPTAAVAPRDYLARTVAACRRHGIALAYDNAYSELTYDDYVAPSIFEVDGAREVALEFFSCSKSYSMTGWRIGFAVGNAGLIRALQAVKTFTDTGPWLAIQQAAVQALEHSEAIVGPMRAELVRRRDAAVAALRAAGFAVEPPKGAMYLWVPLPAGVSSDAFARAALDGHGVVVFPGSGFGAAGEGFFRIALTVGPERLAEGARRLGALLAEWPGAVSALAATP